MKTKYSNKMAMSGRIKIRGTEEAVSDCCGAVMVVKVDAKGKDYWDCMQCHKPANPASSNR